MSVHTTGLGAGLIALLALALPLGAQAESTAAGQSYRQQRLRHVEIRSRADVLGNHPRMERHDVRVAEARIDDDREMKKFDIQAGTLGGSAAAAPRLKVYNDSLEKTLAKILDYIRR